MVAMPSARAAIVEARTYLRPLNEEATIFETPEQATDRIIRHQRWLWQRAKAGMKFYDAGAGGKIWKLAALDEFEEAELEELRALLLDRKLCVSGRTRWLGGTEIAKRRESSQFNPLPRDTPFITDVGVRTFDDFSDGDWTTVLTHQGNWCRARVAAAGIRNTLKLVLRRGRSVQEQVTSIDHTWILHDGTRVEASQLKVGDKLFAAPHSTLAEWDFDAAPPDEQSWWCYGFVYGDGALCGATSRVRLCGDKAKHLPKFTACGFGHSYPPSCDQDPFVYTGHYLKTLPDVDADPRLIRAFLIGYLAADGVKKLRHGRTAIAGISTTSVEAADFIRTWAPRFGLYILSEKTDVRETNYGCFQGVTFSFMSSLTAQGSTTTTWQIIEIREHTPQDCWCLTVDVDHSFVLANGIVTGNCSFLEVRTVHDVVDAFWLLLQGCGVGFKPVVGALNGFTRRMEIEVVRSERGPRDTGPEANFEEFNPLTGIWTIYVGDSSEAWAKAAGKLVAGKHPAKKLVISFEGVRGGGGRLKSYGWISSGDDQIAKAFEAIAKLLNDRAGELLTAIDILDIINWLGTALSSRRSAEIALLDHGDPEWEAFAVAKKDHYTVGQPQRAMSNNSLMFHRKPTKYELKRLFKMMLDAGGSEPGFINAVEAKRRAPWFKGVNPCAEILLGDKSFCVSGDTPLITRQGIVSIADSVGKPIEIWNGLRWSTVTPFQTGKANKLLRVHFGDGSYLDCTEYHRFSVRNRFETEYREVMATQLRNEKYVVHTEPFTIDNIGGEAVENAYTIGFAYGDGHSNTITLYGDAKIALPLDGRRHNNHYRQNPAVAQQTVKTDFNIDAFTIDDVFTWDRVSALKFCAGLADADGSETGTGGIRIYQADEAFVRRLHLLLLKNGIRSSVCKMANAGTMTNFGPRKNAIWYVQITDAREIPCQRLNVSEGHTPNRKGAAQTIRFIEELPGVHPSYCFTEPERGMGVFNGTLTYQCNLVETVLCRFNGDDEGLHRAHWIAARANYRQTCVDLRDGVLQTAWHELNEFLRLCGVGVTGVVAWEHVKEPAAWIDLHNSAVKGAHSMAHDLGMPQAKAVTTIKPSGTQSKASGIVGMEIPEGLHTPLGRFIFNRVRFSIHDPVVQMLRDGNYRLEPDPYDATAVLAVLPVEYQHIEFSTIEVDGKKFELNLEPAVEQLERYRIVMEHYVDHNASITVNYSPDEVPDIIDWLMANWDDYVGVSFILRPDPVRMAREPEKVAEDLGYPYLPQTPVDEQTFREYADTVRPIRVAGSEAVIEVDAEECSTGACPVR